MINLNPSRLAAMAAVAATLAMAAFPSAAATCYEQRVASSQVVCGQSGSASADFATSCVSVPTGYYQVAVTCPTPPPAPAPVPTSPTPPPVNPAPTPASCTLNGVTRSHGQSATFYFEPSVPFILKCKGVSRTCNNGTFGGDSSYRQPSCYVVPPKNCTAPWGSTVQHGTDIYAYPVATLPHGYSCIANKRSCWDGFLGGAGTNKTCVNR